MIRKWFNKKYKIPKEVDVSKLNDNVIKLTGKTQYRPNCWNATQLFFGFEEIRYTSDTEMEKWLADNTVVDEMKLCTPGTIVVFRNGHILVHTTVYVAPGLMWHKRGINGSWEFVTSEQAREIYNEADNFEYRLFRSAS